MKIAILLPDLSGGGAERAMLELAREFRQAGDEVSFVLMRNEGDLLDEAAALGDVATLEARQIRNVAASLPVWLDRARPDAMIANMWPLTSLAVVARWRASHRPLLLLVDHNPLSLQYAGRGAVHALCLRASLAATYRSAEARIAVSVGVAADLAALSGVSASRFSVIGNPVAARGTPTDEAIRAAEAHWGPRAGPRILCVGSFKAQKNQAMLLDAVARMPGQERPVLMLLGEGDLRGVLVERSAQLAMTAEIRMPGFQADPTAFYRTADVLALSSDYEGFGNVIVEALAAGLPVVATDCPVGPREILDGGRFGRLVPVGNADAMAQALSHTLASPADRDRLRRRAEAFAPAIAARAYRSLLLNGRFQLHRSATESQPT